MTSKNIISGFRACGVCPFNPSAIQLQSESEDTDSDIRTKSGLAYIPLFTSSEDEGDCSSSDHEDLDEVHTFTKESSIDRFFTVPSPPQKRVVKKKPSAAVLTSIENLQRIQEKEANKAEQEAQKEQRKKEREARKKEKDAQKGEKSRRKREKPRRKSI